MEGSVSKFQWLEYDGQVRMGYFLMIQLGWGIFPLTDYVIILN